MKMMEWKLRVRFEFFREIIIKGRVEFENRNHNSNPYNLCNS